jgi:hypothetical protein
MFSLYTIAVGLNLDLVPGMRNNWIGYLLYFAFTIFNIFVLFNLLVAVISSVYPEKKRKSEGNWRKIVFESMEYSLPDSARPSLQRFSPLKLFTHSVVELPNTFLILMKRKFLRIYPHRWHYGGYTEQSAVGITDADSENEETNISKQGNNNNNIKTLVDTIDN